MRPRDFLKASGAVAGRLAAQPLHAYIPGQNFDTYDFPELAVADRLYQGPFPTDLFPSWNVVMAPTPSTEPVANFGMGLIPYLCDEVGPAQKAGQSLENRLKMWSGCRLAEIEVKGQRHPVRWACKQSLNADGTLTLRPTAGLGESDETGGLAN
jgi:hypothetical protein